jgi:tetratricopeptide (TPR) repeat protein
VAAAPHDRDPRGRRTTRLRAEAGAAEQAGRTDRAIELLEEVVRADPDDRSSLRRVAGLLARARRTRAAHACYRQLAESYEHAGLEAKAIAAWKRVAQNEPGFAGAHVKLGELYAAQGLRADARQHYRRALTIYRGTARAREARQIEERLAELDELSDPGRRPRSENAEPSAAPAVAPGDRAGEPPAEGPAPEPPTQDDVEFVNERLLQARLFRRYALPGQARTQLDALLARFPDHVEARRELRDLLQETGQHDEAVEQQRLLEALENGATAAAVATGRPPTAVKKDETDAAAHGQSLQTDDSAASDGRESEADLGDLRGLKVVLDEEAGPSLCPRSVVGRTPGAYGVLVSPAPERVVAREGIEAPPEPESEPDVALEDLELVPEEEPRGAPDAPLFTVDLDEPLPAGELRSRVDEQVGRDDYEMRYDLGIAYREMGLLDEAIAELQLASRGPTRFVECTSLLAACFQEKGLPQLAVRWLERGLAAPGLGSDQVQSLRYDLASVLEAGGDLARARDLYTEIYGEDAGFRDVADKLRRLGEHEGTSGDGGAVVFSWRRR